MADPKKRDQEDGLIDPNEADERSEAALRRLLLTPPHPKPKRKGGASPKKRGRPPKAESQLTKLGS